MQFLACILIGIFVDGWATFPAVVKVLLSAYIARFSNLVEWFKGFTAETWIAFGAAAIALVALYFTGLAARAARDQTGIQKQLRIDAAQPYVWVDIREDSVHAGLINFVLGNSGPTVATNVRVRVSRPLPARGTGEVAENQAGWIRRLENRLAVGFSSLAPGREMLWSLGMGKDIYAGAGPRSFTFTVTADGPLGPVEPLSYTVDMDDWVHMAIQPQGTLDEISKSIKALATKLGK